MTPRLKLAEIMTFSLYFILRFQMNNQGNAAKKKSAIMQTTVSVSIHPDSV